MMNNLSSFFSDPASIDALNSIVNQTSDSVMCGPGTECEKRKTGDDLEKKYEAAQINIQTAPSQLDKTEKDYYVYTKGQAVYNQMLEGKIDSGAISKIADIQSAFNTSIENVEQLDSVLHSLTIHYKNELDLYSKYDTENKSLTQKIEEIGADTITNDRKTYYESENYEYLGTWYFVWKWIYIILCIVLIIALFMVPNIYSNQSLSFVKKAGIISIFIAYPFVIDRLVLFFTSKMYQLGTMIPKNVYV